MSKEFQIRDGNLIASFDLENEDGDIDFCKLLKVSHGVADEIGMFVDYVATNKIIKDQSKQIADLETKLAEKEERINWLVEAGFNRKWAKKYVEMRRKEEPMLCLPDSDEVYERYFELKQQLEEYKQSLKETIDHYEKYCSEINHQNVMLYAAAFNAQQASQDKISFAVEQLEKVKEYIKTNLMSFQKVPIIQEINNQIKQLTHQHEDKGE